MNQSAQRAGAVPAVPAFSSLVHKPWRVTLRSRTFHRAALTTALGVFWAGALLATAWHLWDALRSVVP